MSVPVGPDQPREDDSPPTEASDTRGTLVAPLGLSAGACAFGPPAARGEVGTLGPYRIVQELGRGGMGAVYAAVDARLNRPVALKVMLPHHAAEVGARERFLREARAAAQIVHDNVVMVFEADVRDGIPYIAMQFLEGSSLEAYLRNKGAPTIQQVLRIAREAAAGLAAAHARGLVHRDIKPANLWLEAPEGRVKVLDFGLARSVNAEVEITTTGAVIGTPAYMSPEQGRGDKVDYRTDLFSLGAVLYRLVTGRPPFNGSNAMAVLTALATQEPTPVRELNPTVPEPLAELIHELLAKELDDRPQSAAEVVRRVADIEAVLTAPSAVSSSQPQVLYVPIQVMAQPQANPFTDLDPSGGEAFPSMTDPTEVERAPRKSGGLWAGVGLAVVLAVVGGGVIYFKTRNATEPSNGSSATASVTDGKLPAPVRPAGPVDPDRRAAEWALSLGGTVYVNGTDQQINAPAELPKTRFSLTGVRVSGNKVTDADLVYLKDLKELTALHLSSTPITSAGVALLKDLKGLRELFLDSTEITDAGLVHLKEFTSLKELSLAVTAVTDTGLKQLAELKELSVLNLGATPVTGTGLAHFKRLKKLWLHHAQTSDEGLKHIKELKALEDLNLGDTKVTDAGLVHLKELPALSVLHLYQTGVTNAGLAHLTGHPALMEVWLSDTKVTDAGLVHFKSIKGLKGLGLNGTKVTDAGLEHLKSCPELTYLTLLKTEVTPKGLREFAAAVPAVRIETDDRKVAEWVLSLGGIVWVSGKGEVRAADQLPKDYYSVTWVDLSGTKVTDAELAHLAPLKELDIVWLNGTTVTDAGLEHFRNLKQLKVLHLGGTKVADAGLAHLRGLTELEILRVEGTTVSDAGLAHLKELKGLWELWLDSPNVTDAGLAHLKGLARLRNLNLNGTQVTDTGLAHLKDLKELTLLNLMGTRGVKGTGLAGLTGLEFVSLSSAPVTDEGMAALKGLKNLKGLHLFDTKVTDAGLVHLKELKALQDLVLEKTGVTDAGLIHLKELKELKFLLVKQTQMTAKALEEFHAAVPECKITHDGGVIEPKK